MKRSAALLLTIALVAAPATAQRSGTRIGSGSRAGNADSSLDSLAQCVAGRKPAYVDRWFATLPGSAEENAIVRREANGDFAICMQTSLIPAAQDTLAFRAATLRTRVAAEMVRTQIASMPVALPVAGGSQGWWAPALLRAAADAPLNRQALGVQDFGHCVAMADWPQTRALLQAPRASIAEKAAITTLRAALPGCIDSDLQFALTPATLRLALAEPVFHILRGDVSPAQAALQ